MIKFTRTCGSLMFTDSMASIFLTLKMFPLGLIWVFNSFGSVWTSLHFFQSQKITRTLPKYSGVFRQTSQPRPEDFKSGELTFLNYYIYTFRSVIWLYNRMSQLRACCCSRPPPEPVRIRRWCSPLTVWRTTFDRMTPFTPVVIFLEFLLLNQCFQYLLRRTLWHPTHAKQYKIRIFFIEGREKEEQETVRRILLEMSRCIYIYTYIYMRARKQTYITTNNVLYVWDYT